MKTSKPNPVERFFDLSRRFDWTEKKESVWNVCGRITAIFFWMPLFFVLPIIVLKSLIDGDVTAENFVKGFILALLTVSFITLGPLSNFLAWRRPFGPKRESPSFLNCCFGECEEDQYGLFNRPMRRRVLYGYWGGTLTVFCCLNCIALIFPTTPLEALTRIFGFGILGTAIVTGALTVLRTQCLSEGHDKGRRLLLPVAFCVLNSALLWLFMLFDKPA